MRKLKSAFAPQRRIGANERSEKLHRNVGKVAWKQHLLKVLKNTLCACVGSAVHSRVCVCVFVLAERAVWAVLKCALRVQESPWPAASN